MAQYLLMLEPTTADKKRMIGIHYKPEQLGSAEKAAGALIESTALPPDPPLVRGQDAALYLNTKTGVLAYEYEARPLTQEELLADVLAGQVDIVKRLEKIEGLLLKVP